MISIAFFLINTLISLYNCQPYEVLASSNACGYSTTWTATIFNAPYDGQLSGIKAVYNTGNSNPMTCASSCPTSKWGCDHCGDRKFMVEFMKVTDAANYAGYTLYPTTNTLGYITYTTLSCSRGCTQQLYYLNGQDIDDDTITWTGETYDVTTNDQFMMQVGEGCCQITTADNFGDVCAEIYFLYDNYKNCSADGEIKHLDWDKLQNAGNNSIQLPYSALNVSFHENSLELEFDIDLEYVGTSKDGNFDHGYNLGTTYVIDFQSFGVTGNKINEPGSCQNRLITSFSAITDLSEMWGYSDFPHQANNLGTNTYLSYPPPSNYWTLSIEDASCSPINYNGIFSWKELSECTNFAGNDLITVIDDGTRLTLSGTLYVNLVSPYSWSTTDAAGPYRVRALIQQDFEISILKQINVLSSTGTQLFIASVIGIYEDETDKSFKLSVFTQSADYISLTNPNIISTPLGSTATIIEVTSTCLVASSYTCGQIYTITINESQISCPPADFSGMYQMLFIVTCDGNQAVCNTFIADNEGPSVALEVTSNFVDRTCEAENYQIIFTGNMEFYDDETFTIIHDAQNGDNDYIIGQSMIYVEVEVDLPDNIENLNIFGVEIDNVFVCTADDGVDLTNNLDQQSGTGGCLSSTIDVDGPYNVITNGVVNTEYQTQIISSTGTSNMVRFAFLTFQIGRNRMYIHAQLTLVLQNGNRRRLRLLQATDNAGTSDQIRHFIGSAAVSENILSETIPMTTTETDSASISSISLVSAILILFVLSTY